MMKCQMNCGGCKADATLSLKVGGSTVSGIDMVGLKLAKYRAPARTLMACDKHAANLVSCGVLYGTIGQIQKIA